jgi:hypothetical protein
MSKREQTNELKTTIRPPFEIYRNGVDIADEGGHICTAENHDFAIEILKALNALYPDTAPRHRGS